MPQIKRSAATLIFKVMQKAIVIDLSNGKTVEVLKFIHHV